ncbi:MAG: hypothetical protein H7A47_10615 [Verrucomicrobiales bacterium]|nr:hypothetical protein [Verrucomicrobiales bacterium]
MNNGAITGGRLTLFSSGLNWYLHPHVRWQFNYVHGTVDGRGPSEDLNVFETRVEVDF